MGLDIYVEWKGMTRAERDAQVTGFGDAPEYGYLRLNWTGVGLMAQVAEDCDWPNPVERIFPQWEGSNGEGFEVTPEELTRLADCKTTFEQWLAVHPVDEDLSGEYIYFHRKMRAAVTLIVFVQNHADKPNLEIIYG